MISTSAVWYDAASLILDPAVVQFSQNKADGQIRWAVLNTISVLRRHKVVHGQLAEAMAAGQSVSCCISLVEAGLRDSDDI